MSRYIFIIAFCGLAGSTAVAESTDARFFVAKIRPLLDRYCVACHNQAKARAEYRLDNIAGDIAAGDDTIRWEKALEMIGLEEMPPEDAERHPTKAERQLLEDWIAEGLKKNWPGRAARGRTRPSRPRKPR